MRGTVIENMGSENENQCKYIRKFSAKYSLAALIYVFCFFNIITTLPLYSSEITIFWVIFMLLQHSLGLKDHRKTSHFQTKLMKFNSCLRKIVIKSPATTNKGAC